MSCGALASSLNSDSVAAFLTTHFQQVRIRYNGPRRTQPGSEVQDSSQRRRGELMARRLARARVNLPVPNLQTIGGICGGVRHRMHIEARGFLQPA